MLLPLLDYYKQISSEFSLARLSSYSFFHSLYLEFKSLPSNSSIAIPVAFAKIGKKLYGTEVRKS